MKPRKQINIRNSISTKLLKVVFSLYLLIAVAVTLTHMLLEYRYQKNSITDNLVNIQKTFEQSLSVNFWQLNRETLESEIKGILQLPDIIGVKILNKKGDNIAIGGIVPQGNMLGNVGAHINFSGITTANAKPHNNEPYKYEIFEHQFPLAYTYEDKRTPLGTATIYSSSAVVYKRVKLGFLMLVVNALIKTTALWVIFLWVSNILLKKPLTRLATATSKVNLENLDSFKVDIKTTGQNELKVLETSFNTMIKNLNLSIIQLKNTENALRKSEEKFRGLVESSSDWIWEVNSKGVYTYTSPQVEALLGYKMEEIIGKKPFDLMPPENAVRVEKIFKDLVKKGAPIVTVENVNLHKDGRRIILETSGVPILDPDGKTIGYRGVDRDITIRKKAEEDLIRLGTAIEHADEIIFITDKDGIILYVNPAFERITGFSTDEAIGQKPSILKSHKQDTEFYEKLWHTISQGETWKGHFINKKKDGSLYTEDATISSIANIEGDIINYVAVKRDVTQNLKMEDQIRQSQKMESIGTLAGGIAHDFNNILAAIMGFTELSMDDVKDRPDTHKSLEQALVSAHRAKDLVKQILTFSRSANIDKKPVRATPILKEVCKFMRSLLPKTIEIRQQVKATQDWTLADPTQLHQILMNLCTNAGQAMKDKPGILDVLIENTFIFEKDQAEYPDLSSGPYLKLTVKDTGQGISRENLGRLFEPYFTTKRPGEGTGLGLAVVHGIVKDYGGDIRVSSKIGKGTKFQVLLPLLEETVETDQTSSTEPIPTGTEKILFVDDEELLLKLGKLMLERLGYTVTVARNGEEAINIFKRSSKTYGAVITDNSMPKMGGMELTREIKKIRPEIPILLCTGYLEKELEDTIKKAGINGLIMKPVNKQEIAETLRKVLDQKNG